MSAIEAGGPEDVWILVMGPTGSGKSTFINCLSNETAEIGNRLESVTSQVREFACDNVLDRRLWLIDTASWDDTNASLSEVVGDLVSFLNKLYSRGIKLSGILFLHRITDVRFFGSRSQILRVLRRLAGDEAAPMTFFVTTFWDYVEEGIGIQREIELKESHWANLIERGSHVLRFKNVSRDAAVAVIRAVVANQHRHTLKVQSQMVDEGLELGETEIGPVLADDLRKGRQAFHGGQIHTPGRAPLASNHTTLVEPGTQSGGVDSLHHRVARQLVLPKPDPQDIIIAVMGITGAGKSTFIQHFTTAVVPISSGLESCTREVSMYRCSLPTIPKFFLIDTPGFDDTYRSDGDVLEQLAEFLTSMYTSEVLLTGVIYLHSIVETRFGTAADRNIHMFRHLVGDDALRRVVLATTFWDVVRPEEGISREHQLRTEHRYWASMVAHGSKVYRHDQARESGTKILHRLTRKKRQILLSLQQELVNERIPLPETKAGLVVAEELLNLKEKHERQLAEILEDMRLALAERDLFWQQKLEDMKRQYEADLERQLGPPKLTSGARRDEQGHSYRTSNISGEATAILGNVSHHRSQTFYIQNATLVFGDKEDCRGLKRRREDSDDDMAEHDRIKSILREFLAE